MVGAATYGTAHESGKGAAYSIAGKTGTAQVFTVAQNAKYNEKTVEERLRDHAWFIAFAPVEAPRIAVAVLVENGGFGASCRRADRPQGHGCISPRRRRQAEGRHQAP